MRRFPLSFLAISIQLGLLLALPLLLRYLTARRMRTMRELTFDRDEEFQRMKKELDTLMDDSRQVTRRQRHYELRKTRLQEDVAVARRDLTRLRTPASERMAA
jgi:hypothetical protein